MSRCKIEPRDRTKSYWFLTPMLEIDPTFMQKHLLLNTYLGSEDLPDIKQSIFLLYEFRDFGSEFARLEKWFKNTSHYRGTYDPDKYTTMFYFHVPKNYYNDYLLFLNGKYSQLDNEYKKRMLRFHNSGYNSDLYKVLYKDKQRKEELEKKLDVKLPEDAEVASMINYETEIYSKEHKINDLLEPHDIWKTILI